jgi:hypothetical protein
MPETLTFGSSCTIGLIGGTCGVDQQTNIVTVNDITNVTLPEDVLIKMVVQPGTNPPEPETVVGGPSKPKFKLETAHGTQLTRL